MTQTEINFSVPYSNATTSLDAAVKVSSRSKSDESRLLAWIRSCPAGATDEEIAVHFAWDDNYVRPRRWQLSDRERLITWNGQKRRNSRGNWMKVWEGC